MLIIELPFAVGCVLITLTLVRGAAAPTAERRRQRRPRRRRVLLSCTAAAARSARASLAAVVLPSWRGATLVATSTAPGSSAAAGTACASTALPSANSPTAARPSVLRALALQLAVPWRFVFCAREMLEAGEARSRRRACLASAPRLPRRPLPAVLPHSLRHVLPLRPAPQAAGTAGFFSSALRASTRASAVCGGVGGGTPRGRLRSLTTEGRGRRRPRSAPGRCT